LISIFGNVKSIYTESDRKIPEGIDKCIQRLRETFAGNKKLANKKYPHKNPGRKFQKKRGEGKLCNNRIVKFQEKLLQLHGISYHDIRVFYNDTNYKNLLS